MALIKTEDPELAIMENKDQIGFVDATRNFLSCNDDIKDEGTIESCTQLEKQDVSLEVNQKMYLAVNTGKFDLTHRKDDKKGVSTFDYRTNESDYCVVQDANNAMVFHINFMTSDQNVTRLRHQSSIVYYGPQLKPCSIVLNDYRKIHQFDEKKFLLERSEWSSENTKSRIMRQRMYQAADTSAFGLTNGSDDSSAGITDNEEESVKRDQTMDGLPETLAIDAFNNWQQLCPLWSDYDQCSHESYEVFQDSRNSLLFHVRPKTTDSHVTDAKTIRRLHQFSISYCGPELKSCSIPLVDYRVRHSKPNPLEKMAFFAERPKRPKRRSKKSKSHRL